MHSTDGILCSLLFSTNVTNKLINKIEFIDFTRAHSMQMLVRRDMVMAWCQNSQNMWESEMYHVGKINKQKKEQKQQKTWAISRD